jgi:hypothetical protein
MLLLFYLSMMLGLPATTPPAWQLVRQGHGIQVYTADAGDSDFKTIKVVAVFEGSWERFMAIALDVANQPNWVYGTRRASIIRKVGSRELLYQVETDLPWPASDRHSIIRMKIKENPADNIFTITSVGEPQALPPPQKMIRVPQYGAKWEVRQVGKDKLSFTYLLEVDPGGSLPPWIVNLFVSKGPYETFRNLSGLLKK